MKQIDIDEIVRRGGGALKLARALGVSHQTIYNWKRVPVDHIERVEKITGIPRAELRPDLARLFA